MIEFKDVTKVYDNGTTALKDINIAIENGEFVFVVGSSGAGKSTFLKLMMREEVPSKGTITVDGVVLNKLKKRKIPYFRRKLGIVFQDFRLIPNMTVFDNVAFAMRVIGTKEKVIRKRVPYVLSLMGLSQKARNMPNELSGGEQQRVALARALANEADIIIADEPTGNVDPQMSYEIVDLLMKLNANGTTVIMVTHEHDLVRKFDRRVIILDKGEVVSDGGPLISDIATAHINAVAELENPAAPAQTAEQILPVQESVEEIISEAENAAKELAEEAERELSEEASTQPSGEPEEAGTGAEEPANGIPFSPTLPSPDEFKAKKENIGGEEQ